MLRRLWEGLLLIPGIRLLALLLLRWWLLPRCCGRRGHLYVLGGGVLPVGSLGLLWWCRLLLLRGGLRWGRTTWGFVLLIVLR